MRKISNPVDAIAELAVIESGLLAEEKFRLVIQLDEEPLRTGNAYDLEPLVRTTNGQYYVKYYGPNYRSEKRRNMYLVQNDMLPSPLFVYGWKHLLYLARRIPEINWIVRNTNIGEGLFYVAKDHQGVHIPFAVNCVKYAKHITERKKQLGIEDNIPCFGAFCSEEDFARHKYGNKFVFRLKQQEYAQIFKEAKTMYECLSRWEKVVRKRGKINDAKRLL